MRARARRRSPQEQRRLTYGYGVLVALAFVGLLVFGYSAQNGLFWSSYYTLNANVRNAANFAPHTIVRIDGTIAGQVLAVRVNHATAQLQLQLNSSAGPLRTSTVLQPRAQNALGQYFVELIPGRTGPMIPSGGTLPLRQSRPVTELDQVLSMLDPSTRLRTRQLLGELGSGVLGRADDISTTLAEGTGLLTNLTRVAAPLNQPGQPVGRLITTLDQLARTTDPVRRQLATGFRAEAQALSPLRTERSPTRAALDVAPAALAAVTTDLPPARSLLSELGTLAIDTRPLLRVAPAGLTELGRMLPLAGPGLASLNPALQQFNATTAPTLGLLRALGPSLDPAVQTLQNTTATFLNLASRPCQFSRFLVNWGGPNGLVTFGNGGGGFARFRFVLPGIPLAGASKPTAASTADPYPSPAECNASNP